MFKRLGDYFKRTVKTIGHIGSKIYNWINDKPLLQDFSQNAKNFLEVYGESIIVGVKVCRAPINSYLQKFLDNINRGNFGLANEVNKPDLLFHLWMEITFNLNGKVGTCIFEKNDKPEFRLGGKPYTSSIPVPILSNFTIDEMCERAITAVGRQRYFVYRWDSFNCQQFIKDNLTSSPFGYSQQVNDFIMQDLTHLINQVGVQGEFLNKVVNFFSKFKNIGGG